VPKKKDRLSRVVTHDVEMIRFFQGHALTVARFCRIRWRQFRRAVALGGVLQCKQRPGSIST
jgi:hypothetical protein